MHSKAIAAGKEAVEPAELPGGGAAEGKA